MGLLVLLLALLGLAMLADGLREIYAPLGPISLGVALLGAAFVAARSPRPPL